MKKESALVVFLFTLLLSSNLFAASLSDLRAGAELEAATKSGPITFTASVPSPKLESESLRNFLRSPQAIAAVSCDISCNKTDRFAAIDAIWALGKRQNIASISTLQNMLTFADYTVKLNIISALNKINAFAAEPITNIPKADYSKIQTGDLLFRKGAAGMISPRLPVGHTAVFAGMENGVPMIIHAMPQGGVHKANIDAFIAGSPYYGNRTTAIKPTDEQRKEILAWAAKQIGKPYDTMHSTQKGPAKLDCVGLTEMIYEHVGLNPTPDELETGNGWPLEPYEQYDHTIAN